MCVTGEDFAQERTAARVQKIGSAGRIQQRYGSHDAGNRPHLFGKFLNPRQASFRSKIGIGVDGNRKFVLAKIFLERTVRFQNRIIRGKHVFDRAIKLELGA